MEIRNDQNVVVYENGEMIFKGVWNDANDEIKNANGDWYALANCEECDIIVIL